MSEIKFKIGKIPEIKQIIEVYNSSGINRPWKGDELIGVSRSLTDYCYACYLSDLAIKKEYQKEGIGKHLIELTKKEIGKKTALILLSATDAMGYYPKIGFEKIENGFIIKRKK